MWANENTYINITFEDTSQGQLAMRVLCSISARPYLHLNRVIYEWTDVNYLGKITSFTNDELPVGFSHATRRKPHIMHGSDAHECRSSFLVAEDVCLHVERHGGRVLYSSRGTCFSSAARLSPTVLDGQIYHRPSDWEISQFHLVLDGACRTPRQPNRAERSRRRR